MVSAECVGSTCGSGIVWYERSCEMCTFSSGQHRRRVGEWMIGLGLALPILWEQGECCTCVCIWVAG